MVNIRLFLDRSDRKYSPGDAINLEARVQVNSEQRFRSIYVRVLGYAHVSYATTKMCSGNTIYSAHQNYIQQYQTLAGKRSGPIERLSAGTHVYPARFALPRDLPEGHENKHGHIRYEVKLHMDVGPWGFDKTIKTTFYVKPRFDLNELLHLRGPVRSPAMQTFGCACWQLGSIVIYNVLPRTCFVPGDRVQHSLELNNDSTVAIVSATVKLYERIIYSARNELYDTRKCCRTLWSHKFKGNNNRPLVSAKQNKVCNTEIYFSPSWDYHYFTGCGIITVEYFIHSIARTSGCHTHLSNYTPISIGTIPAVNDETVIPPMAPLLSFLLAPVCELSAPLRNPICNQPLPSYNDTQSKAIGSTGTANVETTSSKTSTEVEFMNKKEKPEQKK